MRMVLVALASSARNLGRPAAGWRARLRAIMLLLKLIRVLAILSRGAGSAKSFCARVLVRHLSILLMTRLARVIEVCWIVNNQLKQWFLLGLHLIWIRFSGSGSRRLTQLRFLRRGMQAAEPARLRPRGLRRARFAFGLAVAPPRVAEGEAWWACLDSNQEPDRYERSTLPGNLSKISVSRSGSCTFVRVCSRGFRRITGGISVAAKCHQGLDRAGLRFVRRAAIRVEARDKP
jgi:hypothetical protein